MDSRPHTTQGAIGADGSSLSRCHLEQRRMDYPARAKSLGKPVCEAAKANRGRGR